ncbi:MAG TPA: TIGR04551 family protein [Kofleriaceae bacterium]|nr:TIGR04551 family protein [Kofleriaceae bacterium]
MSPRLLSFLITSAALAALVPAPRAFAQVAPGQPAPGTPTQGPEEKPEGVAEQAPSTPGALPTTPVLPPPRGKRREFQLLELNGFYRFRGDWLKKLHLGFIDDAELGGSPFPQPIACQNDEDGNDTGPCEDTIKTANMKLRLEPVVHLDEKTSLHLQVDLLDNIVYGSTPDGAYGDGTPRRSDLAIGAFTDNQSPPEGGRNHLRDSIHVRRAWAEVETPFGLVKFGRQPNQWGTGIYANGGGADPIHGTYDLDTDYGDTIDRVSFDAGIPGTRFRASIAMDWPSTQPSAGQTDIFADRADGQPFDLDDNDDSNQWTFTFSRLDPAEVFRDKMRSGDFAVNYGAFLVYRTQKFDQAERVDPASPTGGVGQPPDPNLFVRRGYRAYIPDIWLRVALGAAELELEGLAVLGSIDDLSDVGVEEEVDIRQYGGVARFTYSFLDGDLRLGAEAGFASGDQWDNDPQGETHITSRQPFPQGGDETMNAFLFDQDYKIDLILFRELIGAVTNAIYARPSFEYDITDRIRMRIQNVTSFAHRVVSTPGNSRMYGIEMDGDLGYHNDGFSAGIAYGVLFPLGALDHPVDAMGAGGPGFAYGEGNTGDADTAQTIQFRLMLQF